MTRFSRSDSLVNSDVLPPAGDIISILKSILIFLIILNISIQCFIKLQITNFNWLKYSMSLWAALNSVYIHLNGTSDATSANNNFDDTGFLCLVTA